MIGGQELVRRSLPRLPSGLKEIPTPSGMHAFDIMSEFDYLQTGLSCPQYGGHISMRPQMNAQSVQQDPRNPSSRGYMMGSQTYPTVSQSVPYPYASQVNGYPQQYAREIPTTRPLECGPVRNSRRAVLNGAQPYQVPARSSMESNPCYANMGNCYQDHRQQSMNGFPCSSIPEGRPPSQEVASMHRVPPTNGSMHCLPTSNGPMHRVPQNGVSSMYGPASINDALSVASRTNGGVPSLSRVPPDVPSPYCFPSGKLVHTTNGLTSMNGYPPRNGLTAVQCVPPSNGHRVPCTQDYRRIQGPLPGTDVSALTTGPSLNGVRRTAANNSHPVEKLQRTSPQLLPNGLQRGISEQIHPEPSGVYSRRPNSAPQGPATLEKMQKDILARTGKCSSSGILSYFGINEDDVNWEDVNRHVVAASNFQSLPLHLVEEVLAC